MSEEPNPAEAEPVTELVTHQALNARLDLFERGLKERLESKQRETTKQIADEMISRAIETLKRSLDRERQEQRNAESSKQLDRSMEWSKRLLAALGGFVLCLFLGIATSQCSDLHNRLTTLESKQSK